MKFQWTEQNLLSTQSVPEMEADLVVCGGGPAGVAAATVAARQGLKTILVEKNGYCGGAAVAGLSGTICGLYLTQKDIHTKKPKQIVFGFSEEFRQSLASMGGLTSPQQYGNTHVNTFDPLIWREAADNFLENAGVICLYHSLVTGVYATGGGANRATDSSAGGAAGNNVSGNNISGTRLNAIQVESSAGHCIIRAKRFIDASGDAVLISKLGLGYNRGDNGLVQNPTMMFRLSHVDSKAFYHYFGSDTICPPDLTEKLTQAFADGSYNTPRNKIWVFPTPQESVFLMNCTQLAGQKGDNLNVINPEERTYAEIIGRRAAREYHRFFKDKVTGFENSQLIDMAPEVGIRQTRSIEGELRLSNEHVAHCQKTSDAIVRCSWPIELHAGAVSKLHWFEDEYYEIPYKTLVPKNIDNVIVAGRCLSAEHEALASSRVTAQCFEYGHAAALATSLSLENDDAYKNVDIGRLQKRMKDNGSSL